MGLVTKNAILLVDFAIRARSEHIGEDGLPAAALSRSDALLAAARVRMRPILMTTLAMISAWCPWPLHSAKARSSAPPWARPSSAA